MSMHSDAAARLRRAWRPVGAIAILGSLLACSSGPPLTAANPTAPVVTAGPTPAGSPLPASPSATPVSPPALFNGPVRATARGRWVRSDWAELPGWRDDNLSLAWPAWLRSCDRLIGVAAANPVPVAAGNPSNSPTPAAAALAAAQQVARTWAPTCAAARALGASADDAQIRAFAQARLQPWRVESTEGQPDGLLTGYFEPMVEASRERSDRFAVPLYAPPAELATRKPWYTRAQLEWPAAQAALKGRAIAWVADPLDALLVQIQGSGRLQVTEAGGARRWIRIAYAAHNEQPYVSVGRWLVEQGAFTLEQANWPAIRQWARANPQRVRELVNVNPRVVFFREEALPDASIGALGAQGVALTPGRSIAVDRDSIPYGTPVWLASTEPQPWQLNPPPARPLQRLVVAQDTGSAIVGSVRADFYWGWGEGAEDRAGRTKQPLRLWALWPR